MCLRTPGHMPLYPWAPHSSIPWTLMTALCIPLKCCLKNITLTGWPFRSGASWSKEHACVPRHSLPFHSQVLIAAQSWLLSSTVGSSKSSAGAGAGVYATTARCMAACMELLALTQPTQAQGTPARWRGPHNWWNEWPWDYWTAYVVRGPLRRTWYATSWPLASQHSLRQGSSSPRSPPPPWHVPWGLCKTPLLPVLAAGSCDASLS